MCLIVMSNDVRCSKMPLFSRFFGASEGGSHTRGHRFESCCPHHKQTKSNQILFAFSFVRKERGQI